MSFAQPQWLLALPGLLGVLWLLNYLARRRRRITAPSLLIWRRLLTKRPLPRSSSRKFFTLTLLMQWLGTTALLLALASPQTSKRTPIPLNVLLVRSAATLAKRGDNTTVFSELLRTVRKIAPNANVSTLPSGPLLPSHLPCCDVPSAGFDLLATDRPRRTAIPQLIVAAERANAAITHLLAREATDGSLQVLVGLLSTGNFKTRLLLDGVKNRGGLSLSLKPGRSALILNVTPSSDLVTFRLDVDDALSLDNTAYLCRVGRLEEVVVDEGVDEAVVRGLSALGVKVVRSEAMLSGKAFVLNRVPAQMPQKGVFLLFLRSGGIEGVFRVCKMRRRHIIARENGFLFPDALDGLACTRWIDGRPKEVWAESDDGRPVIALFERDGRIFLVSVLDVAEWSRRASFVEFLWRFCGLCGVRRWLAVGVGDKVLVKGRFAVSPSGKRVAVSMRGGNAFFVRGGGGVWNVGGRKIGVALLNGKESRIEPHWRKRLPRVEQKFAETKKEWWHLLLIGGMVLWVVALVLERRG
ncbi:MAG: hypothetical protein DRP63_04495 [Planctomycetota bacterium]|nr:MAG: hypothetical protein DRP63_04495 [Planctomycetota bacterium]